MTWQLLIWNIFIWSFTGMMIYLSQSSLWWLIIPTILTGANDAAELIRATKEEKSVDNNVDEETLSKMIALREKAKRGSL